MSSSEWTIETICDALGDPTLSQRFLGEINRAPVGRLVPVFEEWEGVARRFSAAADRGRTLAAHEARGEALPGEWIDRTDHVVENAERIRARGAA
ncbi:hypothetical protein EYS09_22225 [Streptomyces kasugaensis]|uniref:Uncharacterized protein n=1 Tax=Streptomyces kasugaensis TaxID=1946 RepID=A0A4V2JI78_STRKA|nr:hypothetical protein [Streptomyces kasugaensis]TBO57531.1 hypothetical protein EYS09_22225 [Streptomyces kasugaensis]